jgi:hypothetical protein
MANTQATFGFQQFGYLPGGAVDYQMSHATILSTYSTIIGNGDPVMKTSASVPYIIQATGSLATTQPLMGIFVGCYFIPSGGGPPQWSPCWPGAQGSNGTAYIIDAPNALFRVAALQTAITSANIGQAVNFTTGVPSTTGGAFSVATIDQSTATSSGTTVSQLPFKIVGLYPGVGNGSDPTTNYNWAIVTFNNQIYQTRGSF